MQSFISLLMPLNAVYDLGYMSVASVDEFVYISLEALQVGCIITGPWCSSQCCCFGMLLEYLDEGIICLLKLTGCFQSYMKVNVNFPISEFIGEFGNSLFA